MPDPDKRKMRELKRVLKKRGTKHRRQSAKQKLATDPEAASEHEDDFGGYRSDTLNGMDRDSKPKE